MLRDTELRFVFEVRYLRLKDDWLTFYIKPEDGLELPKIRKRLKQTFAERYNRETGRTGHIWGDRYWSRILEGDPPEDKENGGAATAANTGVRPHNGKNEGPPVFRSFSPAPPLPHLDNGGKPPCVPVSINFPAPNRSAPGEESALKKVMNLNYTSSPGKKRVGVVE
ncbi:MAG: hypothetical protein LBB83_02445 [Treponema sp.]|nr:hypothetical protein [Treponema sp.]